MVHKPKKEVFESEVKKPRLDDFGCSEKNPDATARTINFNSRTSSDKEIQKSIEQLRKERDFFQEAISAVSHPFYVIDANNNRYVSIDSNALEYDAAGNLTKDKEGYEYSYDYENRLMSVAKNSQCKVRFYYDALGRFAGCLFSSKV